jgi:hypothetical protein
MANFQRIGSISNAHVGKEFEETAATFFSGRGLNLKKDHSVLIGVGQNKKPHKFDLGSDNPKTIIECKSHKWTAGNNIPSAKLTVWNEAMYYFASSPPEYKKIFFVLRDERSSNGEALAEYYIRIYGHMIPDDVEIWEYNPLKANAVLIHNVPI